MLMIFVFRTGPETKQLLCVYVRSRDGDEEGSSSWNITCFHMAWLSNSILICLIGALTKSHICASAMIVRSHQKFARTSHSLRNMATRAVVAGQDW